MSDDKICWKPSCNRIVRPEDPDSIPVVPQCGKCTRAIRERNRERKDKGYVSAEEENGV